MLDDITSLNITIDNPSSIYHENNRLVRYQVGISLVLGLCIFVTFAFLRVKYPKIYMASFNNSTFNYVHSSSRKDLPKLPQNSLFGWIPVLYKVNEDMVLEHAGLDAMVFLQFFKMCIKSLSICLILALTILSPIRYKLTGRVDYPDDDDDGEDNYATLGSWSNGFLADSDSSHHLLWWMYTVFTYVFTFIIGRFLFKQTSLIIGLRQKYLGGQCSITDRTIKVSGLPGVLRDKEALKSHLEGLGIGKVDSIVIVKEWNELNRLFHMRKGILRLLEEYWVEYFDSIGIQNKNDLLSRNLHPNLRELITMNNTSAYQDEESESVEALITDLDGDIDEDEEEDTNSVDHRTSNASLLDEIRERIGNELEDSVNQLPLLNDELNMRPKLRKGFLGIFGKKVDAINYYTEQLDVVDKEIIKARSRYYPPTSTAFVTMQSVAQAQVLAQAVIDPKVNHLITRIAPAPHDISWENLCLTRRERNFRIFIVSLAFGMASILLVYPVRFLTNFLNVNSISKLWPELGVFLENNKWAESLVTGILPPYIFTIFNIVMPYFYIWISSIQGYTSHDDEELSSVSMNFFYIFVNLFLVFTLFGTASLSDTSKIASQLAQSLKDLSLFYVDFIILQGLAVFPYKLLLMGNLLKFSIGSLFWCKTPRDYLKLYKPPTFNFGLHLPQPILILIITVVYAAMSTKILTAGLIYFIIGYFVYKYQLLYACVHPPHSTGKVWPLIFRRVILGILLFQITMVGILVLQLAYICAFFLVPLPIITLSWLWNYQKSYIPLSIFIALRSIENNESPYYDEESNIPSTNVNNKSLDERRELNKTYDYPRLMEPLDGPLIAIDQDNAILVNHGGIVTKKVQALDEWNV